MIISFDIDDVLAEFQLGWIEFNARNYDLHFEMEDITDYDYSKTGMSTTGRARSLLSGFN